MPTKTRPHQRAKHIRNTTKATTTSTGLARLGLRIKGLCYGYKTELIKLARRVVLVVRDVLGILSQSQLSYDFLVVLVVLAVILRRSCPTILVILFLVFTNVPYFLATVVFLLFKVVLVTNSPQYLC